MHVGTRYEIRPVGSSLKATGVGSLFATFWVAGSTSPRTEYLIGGLDGPGRGEKHARSVRRQSSDENIDIRFAISGRIGVPQRALDTHACGATDRGAIAKASSEVVIGNDRTKTRDHRDAS